VRKKNLLDRLLEKVSGAKASKPEKKAEVSKGKNKKK
jgi:hypothetical protein